MTATTQTLKNDDATTVGTLSMHSITTLDGNAAAGNVGVTVLATVSGGAATSVATSNPLPISDAGGSITIDGSVSITGNLPDTAAGDLAAINAALAGTLTVGSHAVTNVGTFAVQVDGDALTALQLLDDAVYTDGVGTPSKGFAVMGTDGTNPQIVSVDTAGRININVNGTVAVDGSGVTQPVSAASLPLPSGAATAANQTTANASLSSINAQLASSLAVQAQGAGMEDSAATGNPVLTGGRYDATPRTLDNGDAGAFAIDTAGRLQVSIEADNAGIGGGTQYAVDTASGGTDTGTMALAVRDDSLTTLTPVDGDYVPLRVNSTGALHVTGGGGGTEYNEDDATPGTITGTATMMERDDALGGLTPIEGDWAAMRCDANGALWVAVNNTVAVSDGGGSLTIDGTVTANLSATDNAVLDSIDAAVNGTLTVGSHAVTNAGTFAVQVDGDALTALQLIDDIVATDDTSTHATGTTKGAVIMAAATPTDGTVDANDLGALAMSTDRRLLVDAQIAGQDADVTIADGGNSITVDNAGMFVVQVDGTALTRLSDIETNTDSLAVTGGGTEASALRVTIANDSTGVVTIDDGGGSLTVDGTVGVSGTVAVTDNSGSLTIDLPAVTTGGATPGKLISAASTNATSVKASAGTLYSLQVFNTNASARYLKLYNKASAPTVGTDTPVQVFTIPGNTAGAGLVVPIPACGIAFGTGIAFATTTGAADSDTGAVAANEIVLSYSYK